MNYKVMRFKSLSSTQDKAKEVLNSGGYNAIIIADTQTRGRGRFKRKWHSAKGGLWMSISLKPGKIQKLQFLTFAASIAVVDAIRKNTGIEAKIRWPNDAHYKGKKLCGILTEGIFGKEDYAIIGIGLNVNQKGFPSEIKTIATSLRNIRHRTFDIESIRKDITGNFFKLYTKYYCKNKTGTILKIYKRCCDTIKKNVTVASSKGKINGEVLGIDKNGNLLLKSKNRIKKIMEGDLRVRY